MATMTLKTVSGRTIRLPATIIDWNTGTSKTPPRYGDGIDHEVQVEMGGAEVWVRFRDLSGDDDEPLDVEEEFRSWASEGANPPDLTSPRSYRVR